MKKYIVTIKKSYINMDFAFERISTASTFIDSILSSYVADEDKDIVVQIRIQDEKEDEDE